MYHTLYKITNKINGRIYVGVHKTDDLNDNYMGSGKLIKKAIRKHGRENFSKEYLSIFDSMEEAYEAESEIVNEEFVSTPETYNMACGGMGGMGGKNEYTSMQESNRKRQYQSILEYEETPSSCKNCGRVFDYSKRRHKFCDKSCAASFNNRLRGKKHKPLKEPSKKEKYQANPKHCLECGNVLLYNQRIADFCSKSCAASSRNRGRKVSEETRDKISKSLKDKLRN